MKEPFKKVITFHEYELVNSPLNDLENGSKIKRINEESTFEANQDPSILEIYQIFIDDLSLDGDSTSESEDDEVEESKGRKRRRRRNKGNGQSNLSVRDSILMSHKLELLNPLNINSAQEIVAQKDKFVHKKVDRFFIK